MPHTVSMGCKHPGCPELISVGQFCASHSHVDKQDNQSYQKDLKRNKLYMAERWKRIRRSQLARMPWCEEHLKLGQYEPASEVDHIEPHHGDKYKFYHSPLQSLCHTCHSTKTRLENNG